MRQFPNVCPFQAHAPEFMECTRDFTASASPTEPDSWSPDSWFFLARRASARTHPLKTEVFDGHYRFLSSASWLAPRPCCSSLRFASLLLSSPPTLATLSRSPRTATSVRVPSPRSSLSLLLARTSSLQIFIFLSSLFALLTFQECLSSSFCLDVISFSPFSPFFLPLSLLSHRLARFRSLRMLR